MEAQEALRKLQEQLAQVKKEQEEQDRAAAAGKEEERERETVKEQEQQSVAAGLEETNNTLREELETLKKSFDATQAQLNETVAKNRKGPSWERLL